MRTQLWTTPKVEGIYYFKFIKKERAVSFVLLCPQRLKKANLWPPQKTHAGLKIPFASMQTISAWWVTVSFKSSHQHLWLYQLRNLKAYFTTVPIIIIPKEKTFERSSSIHFFTLWYKWYRGWEIKHVMRAEVNIVLTT